MDERYRDRTWVAESIAKENEGRAVYRPAFEFKGEADEAIKEFVKLGAQAAGTSGSSNIVAVYFEPGLRDAVARVGVARGGTLLLKAVMGWS